MTPLIAMCPPLKPADPEVFLGQLFPADGNHLVIMYLGENGRVHEGFDCVDDMAARIKDLDANRKEVWHACASYSHPPQEQRPDGSGPWGRKKDNVANLSAFFLDIDCAIDKPTKCYGTLNEALEALTGFTEMFGIPANYLVFSGGGLHAYWFLGEGVPRKEWEPVALMFKNATVMAGLKADPSRTADAASVLRPVGTTNRKTIYGPDGVQVTGQWCRFGHLSLEEFRTACEQISTQLVNTEKKTTSKSCAMQALASTAVAQQASAHWFDRLPSDVKRPILKSLLAALPVASVADHSEWLKVGAALACVQGLPADDLFDLWCAWSQSTASGLASWQLEDSAAQRRRWNTLSKSGVAALIAMAKAAGWAPESLRRTPSGDAAWVAMRQAQDATQSRWGMDEAIEYVGANVVFVSGLNKYLLGGHLVVREALDTALAQRMPRGDRGPMAASSVFKSARGEIAHNIGYMPGGGRIYVDRMNNQKMFNTWDGYAVEPIKPTDDEQATWLAAMRHVANGNKETAAGLIRLSHIFGYLLQNPSGRISRAFLIVGAAQGSGKTTLTTAIPQALFGRNNVRIVSDSELHSEFNSFVANSRIIVLPELRQGNRKDALRQNDRLKTLITDDAITVVAKGRDGINVQNVATVFASSNYPDAAAIDGNDRRWDVIETSASQMPPELATPLYKMISGNPGALAYIYLYIAKRADFDPNAPAPKTAAKDRMAAAGRAGWAERLRDAYDARTDLFTADCVAIGDLRVWLSTAFERGPSEQAIRLELQNIAPEAKRIRARKGSAQIWAWVLRNVTQWEAAGPAALYDHYLAHKGN